MSGGYGVQYNSDKGNSEWHGVWSANRLEDGMIVKHDADTGAVIFIEVANNAIVTNGRRVVPRLSHDRLLEYSGKRRLLITYA